MILKNEGLGLLTIDDQDNEKPNLYKIHYCLQIILSLIGEYKKCPNSELILHVEDANAEEPPQREQSGKEDECKDIPSLESMAKTDVDGVVEGKVVQSSPFEESPQSCGLGDSDSDDPGRHIQSFDMTQGPQSTAETVIPLPYHGPLKNGQAQDNIPPEEREVPVAPVSAAAAVGAPDSSNTVTYSTHFITIDDFVGNKVGVPINDCVAETPEEEKVRKEWLPKFLEGGGVGKLLRLIESLSRFTSADRTTSTNTLKIAKKCLC